MRFVLDGMHDVTDDKLAFAAQIGVEGICASAPEIGNPALGYYDYAALFDLRASVESFGLKLEAVQNVPWRWTYKYMLGLPGRDEQVENFQKTIRNVGAAGIPMMGYNFHAMRFYRTSNTTRTRGGAMVTSFDSERVKDAPLFTAGPSIDTSLIPPSHRKPIDDEQMWSNITYFLKAVVPVAEEAGVKMAIHPDDPPVPAIGGVARIMRQPSAFQRVIDTVPSAYNGLLFCQGCYTEMGVNVIETIKHFGRQKKIFWVHFRNVAGTTEKFAEAFPDAGDVDMFETMKAYKDVGFDGPMSADHAVHIIGDTEWGHRYWAYAVAYMRGLKQALDHGC